MEQRCDKIKSVGMQFEENNKDPSFQNISFCMRFIDGMKFLMLKKLFLL
jgi:hypothetical protein